MAPAQGGEHVSTVQIRCSLVHCGCSPSAAAAPPCVSVSLPINHSTHSCLGFLSPGLKPCNPVPLGCAPCACCPCPEGSCLCPFSSLFTGSLHLLPPLNPSPGCPGVQEDLCSHAAFYEVCILSLWRSIQPTDLFVRVHFW